MITKWNHKPGKNSKTKFPSTLSKCSVILMLPKKLSRILRSRNRMGWKKSKMLTLTSKLKMNSNPQCKKSSWTMFILCSVPHPPIKKPESSYSMNQIWLDKCISASLTFHKSPSSKLPNKSWTWKRKKSLKHNKTFLTQMHNLQSKNKKLLSESCKNAWKFTILCLLRNKTTILCCAFVKTSYLKSKDCKKTLRKRLTNCRERFKIITKPKNWSTKMNKS